jgi:hypothetical protein
MNALLTARSWYQCRTVLLTATHDADCMGVLAKTAFKKFKSATRTCYPSCVCDYMGTLCA